jgi:hypothetical protein
MKGASHVRRPLGTRAAGSMHGLEWLKTQTERADPRSCSDTGEIQPPSQTRGLWPAPERERARLPQCSTCCEGCRSHLGHVLLSPGIFLGILADQIASDTGSIFGA